MRIAITAVGTALLLNALYLFIFSNFNLGMVLVLLAGLFFFLWGVFFEKIKKLTAKGAGRAVKIVILILLCCETALILFLAIFGQLDNVSYTEEAIIIPGAGVRGDRVGAALACRLDAAIEYYEKNPDVLIAVTGGQGPQENVTEAYAMERYLVERGVPADNIIKEEKSTSTIENMRFAKELLDKRLGEDYRVVVITNGFHIYRAAEIAKSAGFERVYHKHASLPVTSIASCYLRETAGVLKMWVFD